MQQVNKPKVSLGERIGRGIDSLVGVFNPKAGLARFQVRAAKEMLSKSFPFRGAQKNRHNKDWVTSSGSADEDMLYSLTDLRERSRDLVRNDTHAAGIVLTMKTNVVGVGMKPQSSVDSKYVGMTNDQTEEFETVAEQAFARWVPFADTQGRIDFYEMQDLIEGQILINGEVIIIENRIPDDPNRPYALSYEVIEADRLETPPAYLSDKDVRQGVRLGTRGEPIGYYISRYHPGDTHFKDRSVEQFTYYPIFNLSTGRRQVYHLYEVERPGQSQGLPILTPAIEYFQHKAKYMEAELVAARVAACLVGVIKKENAYESALNRTTADSQGNRLEKMSPGKFEYLNTGEDLQVINPNRPNSAFDPFLKTVLRSISTSIGLPYEIVAKDFSSSNYSTMRSALIEARRYFLKRQDWHQRKFLQPVWCALMEEAFLKRELGDIDFYEKKTFWTAARWVAQGWPWVDPKKEVEASALAIEKGLSTASREAAHQGRDFYEMVDERVRELQYIKKQAEKYGVDLFAASPAQAQAQTAPGTPPAQPSKPTDKPDPAPDGEIDPEADPEDQQDTEDNQGD